MLSDEIKYIRQKSFLSQADFAKQLKVSYSTVNRWETGKSKPNLIAIKALSDFCTNNNISFVNLEREWFALNKKK